MMSDQVVIALIGGITTAVVSTVGAVFAYLSAKALRETSRNTRDTLQVAKETQQNTNGLTQQLIDRTASASHAAGKLEEREEQLARSGK